MTRTTRKTVRSVNHVAGYQRVGLVSLDRRISNPDPLLSEIQTSGNGVRWGLIPLSMLVCIAQALATILCEILRNVMLTGTLIPVLGFILIFLIVLAGNPFLRLAQAALGKWARPLNRAELVCLFTAMLVTAGISTSGLVDPLVPILATPNNPDWNTPARGWNDVLVPSLNAKLYIQDREAIKVFRSGVIFSRFPRPSSVRAPRLRALG